MNIDEPAHSTKIEVNKMMESKIDEPRLHLGCSLLGSECDRWVWLQFRWAVKEKFSAETLRLFRRGKAEEAFIVSDLENIGIKLANNNLEVNFGCHVAGTADGIIEGGVPEAPKSRHVLECKTHSLKSFNDLEKNGVEKAHPKHYVQCQLYMLGHNVNRALYYSVCKDDDRIHVERLRLDKGFAEKQVTRGHRIAMSERMPPPLSTNPTWYKCKMCAGHDFCFTSKLTKEVNCRTCAHVTPKEDSTFECALWDAQIPNDHQLTGCECHVLHPDLVPWKQLPSNDSCIAIYEIDGKKVGNGKSGKGIFSSIDLINNPSICALLADDVP
jgi:hypothetical protein